MPQGVTAQEVTTVNVGVLNTITDIPLILADRKGFFGAEGIKVTFTAFASSSNMVVPLATGQLDVGGGGAGVGLYNAVARKLDIKIVADKASEGLRVRVAARALGFSEERPL
jgi:NitT/TauT family transport system substrate-binding protein